jgi:FkbM family methyltransferase
MSASWWGTLGSKACLARMMAITGFPQFSWLNQLARDYANAGQGLDMGYIAVDGERWIIQRSFAQYKTVFDIGANVGLWAQEACKVNPQLNVHCFEPSQKTFAQLMARPLGPHVQRNKMALGRKPGKATLYIFAEASGINSLSHRPDWQDYSTVPAQQRKETVAVSTLDIYCKKQGITAIDFAKMDVEGWELEVLSGAKALLSKKAIHRVQMEFGSVQAEQGIWFKQVWDFWQSYQYRLYRLLPKGLMPITRYHYSLERFETQNFLAVCPGFEP